MARVHDVQLNIRSRYARERASELARATGMTTAQIVEELRAYTPTRLPYRVPVSNDAAACSF